MSERPERQTLVIHVEEDAPDAAERAESLLVAAAEVRIAESGHFTWAVPGGSTPGGLFSRLSANPEALVWPKVHVLFADERVVPPEHEDSNYRMVKEQLAGPVGLPRSHLHGLFVPEGRTPESHAVDYARLIEQLGGRLDLVMLGIGADGHVASLFPNRLRPEDLPGPVSIVEGPPGVAGRRRLTLNYKTIAGARTLLLMALGESKAPAVAQSFSPPGNEPLPIHHLLEQRREETIVILDRAAASGL